MKMSEYYFKIAEDFEVRAIRFFAVAAYRKLEKGIRDAARNIAENQKEQSIQYTLKAYKAQVQEAKELRA